MRIGIAMPTITAGDAVGNDALGMARVLRGRGHDVDFFAWNSHLPDETVRRFDELPAILNRPEDVLIYHHSIGCDEAVRAVERMRVRKAVKYHNVTPPRFFADNPKVAAACAQGLKEVARLGRSDAHVWADSEYNGGHFRESCPGREVAELPPFHQADQLFAAVPDVRSTCSLDDWNTNVLFVGRIAPNKGLPLAVKAFAEYRTRFDRRARFVIAGDRPIAGYGAVVEQAARDAEVSDCTALTGRVTVAQLKALYLTADLILVTSEHEGFCVPLVEAMGLRVPVVAVPNAAVPFTGGDAVEYAEAQPDAIAWAMHTVLSNDAAREAQLRRGWTRYEERFTNAAIERRFLELFGALTGERPA